MDISIVDKFISNSITFIQQQNKSKLTQEKIFTKINNDLKKLTDDPNITNIINELILISINIFSIIYKKILLLIYHLMIHTYQMYNLIFLTYIIVIYNHY